MALKKITEEEMNAQGVIAAPDILNGTPAQNKAIFDRMVRNLVAPAVNACAEAVDEVNDNQEEWSKQEQTRETNEEGRKTAEVRREEAEAARQQAEQERKTAEETRKTNESARVNAEQERRREYTEMTNAEFERAEAERLRKQAETGREENETKRAEAESSRNQTFAQIKNLVENLDAEAQTLEAGAEATADVTVDPETGGYNVRFGIPRGKDGIGGMDAAVYDPQGKKTDIFAYTDLKVLAIMKPEYFGAAADGVTDDSAAIQAAIDAGAAQSMPVYLAKKNYKISNGLFIRNNYAIFRCDGTLTYDGTDSAVTLTNTLRSVVEINTIDAQNGTAVRLSNVEGRVTFNQISINNIRSSKTGIHLTTPNQENLAPIYYNKISYMEIVATEIGVHVDPSGYMINENRYYGGTIGGGCFYGIKIGNSGVAYDTGANKFLSGGIEGVSDDGYGIYLENTERNVFKNIRTLERYGKYLIGFVGNAKLNHIEVPRAVVSEIDISNLGEIGNFNNVINCMTSDLNGDGGATGETIQVNGNFGIVYDTKKSNNAKNTIKISLTNFPDGVIKPIDNRIYSSFQSTVNSLNGQTITLGEIYYGTRSLLKGEPIVFSFGSGTGRIKLVDVDGDTIFDATDGKFDGKTISVKWSGYWGGTGDRNLWDISVEGQYGMDGKTPQKGVDYLTEAEKTEWVADVIAALPIYNGEVGSV